MTNEIYVVVAENDQNHSMPDGSIHSDDGGPIVFETYIKDGSLDSAKSRVVSLGNSYGKTRIAKLQFIDEE